MIHDNDCQERLYGITFPTKCVDFDTLDQDLAAIEAMPLDNDYDVLEDWDNPYIEQVLEGIENAA